ncbi:hypothetical protein GSI_05479 [Ganoderma sinense ZZ0214-1]|uniref:Uncharacterized protein n=1 Tax=Ganoderma sinense ZZ0214-1 TaxID=1077348 RepID=A0A2G8SEN4_9APHY|nr:hypothetical protein GSI_05479 [Ganoderma sinense ZZ0214-1]
MSMSQSAVLRNARASYAASVIAGVAYGAYAILAAICIHFLLKRRSNGLPHRIILTYTILMFAVTTIYYATGCVWAEVEFVESTANIELYDLQTNSRLSVIKNTAYVFDIYLADSLLIHRLFVVWEGLVPVIVFPSIVWCGTIATGIGLLWSSSRQSASLIESEIIHWQTSFYSCTVSHNIMCTVLIAGRLWYHHGQARKIKALEGTPYSSIIAIIVESAALYSLCGIVYIPLVVKMLPAQFPVTALIGSLTAIAPNLIILRMALGTAASSPAEMSTMAFELSTNRHQNSQGLSRASGIMADNPLSDTPRTAIPLSGGDDVWACEVKSTQLSSAIDQGSFV